MYLQQDDVFILIASNSISYQSYDPLIFDINNFVL